jgi:hypothetical protein
MKFKNTLLAIVVASFLTAGLSFAADAQPAAPAAKVAGCCAKAAKDHKTCTHECCVAANKAGKNCEKCGGSGALEVKK